jgi:hypothetical protein
MSILLYHPTRAVYGYSRIPVERVQVERVDIDGVEVCGWRCVDVARLGGVGRVKRPRASGKEGSRGAHVLRRSGCRISVRGGGGKWQEKETGSCDLSDVDQRFKGVLERVTQLLVPVKRLHTRTDTDRH